MLLNRAAHRPGRAILRHNDSAAVGQRVQQGVNAADMVELEEHDGAKATPRSFKLLQQRLEVVDKFNLVINAMELFILVRLVPNFASTFNVMLGSI